MKKIMMGLVVGCFMGVAAFGQDLVMDWAYHDDSDGNDDRATETVPGEGYAFVGNGSTVISDTEPVTLYILTGNQFAGDAEEQVFVRWWNGQEEKWIMAEWVKNIFLGTGENEAGRFHGLPDNAPAMLDLWKVVVSPDLTRPGENFYVIQIKGWKVNEGKAAFLLRDPMGDFSKQNNVGQTWTASDEYGGHDWKIDITP